MPGNPWQTLPQKPPYILPQDKEALEQAGVSPERLGLRLDLLPVPWIGDVETASVVLLTLNPSLGDVAREMSDQDFRDAYLTNLKGNASFLWLDDKFRGNDGHEYWMRLLRKPIELLGIERVSRRIMCVQYFPYRSATYVHAKCVVPSQRFSWGLAKQAVVERRLVVIQRSWPLWVSAVPELLDYSCIRLRNVRSPFLSEGNMPADDWERLLSALST